MSFEIALAAAEVKKQRGKTNYGWQVCTQGSSAALIGKLLTRS